MNSIPIRNRFTFFIGTGLNFGVVKRVLQMRMPCSERKTVDFMCEVQLQPFKQADIVQVMALDIKALPGSKVEVSADFVHPQGASHPTALISVVLDQVRPVFQAALLHVLHVWRWDAHMLVGCEDGGAAVAADRIAFRVHNVKAMAAATVVLPLDVLDMKIY